MASDERKETARQRLVKYGAQLQAALDEVERCKSELRSFVRGARQDGLTEVEISRYAGISRPTVRDWLGK
jgi:hypothetical protein